MTNIYLSVDTGYSDTKVCYRLEGEDLPRYFLMSSKIASVTQAQLKNYQERKGWLSCSSPERQAWLEMEQQTIVVGSLAEEFAPIDCREEPKYGTSLYKVLTAIGVIIQKHLLSTRKKIKIYLGILIPGNEYSDAPRLQKVLKATSENYKFRGQTIKVKIEEKIACRPEGGGLAMARFKLNGEEWFARQRLGVLMFGSRNLTGLYFECGDLKVVESPLMGFSYLVGDIVEQTSGLTPEKLTEAIFLGLRKKNADRNEGQNRPVWSELEAIKNLATARSPSLRSEEVVYIASVIEAVAQDWEGKIERWLKKTFPSNLTEISISGGSLPFFTPMLEQHFNCSSIYSETQKPLNYQQEFVPIYLGAGIVPHVEKALQLKTREAVEQALSYRLIDCYAVLSDLIDTSLEGKELEKTASV